mgnify:CR=1 FL=1
MHRPTIGIIAILLFVTAACLFPYASDGTSAVQALFAACIKVGILMAVVWLAHPHLSGFPWWLLAIIGAVVAMLLIVRQPRTTLVVLFVVLVVLRVRNFLARAPKSES